MNHFQIWISIKRFEFFSHIPHPFSRCSLSFIRCIWKLLKARKGEVSATVRNVVDALMSRSKHTIPHAQSSPCVNLSIGSRARQVQDGQEGVEPKTGNRKVERDIKGCETRVREIAVRNLKHLFFICFPTPHIFLIFLFDTEDTEAKCRPDSKRPQLASPASQLFSADMVKLLRRFVLRMNSCRQRRALLLSFSGTDPVSWQSDTDNELNTETFVLPFSVFCMAVTFTMLFC